MVSFKLGMVLVRFHDFRKSCEISPSKKDDIMFDAIIKPVFNLLKPKK